MSLRLPPDFAPIADDVKPAELGKRVGDQFRSINGALVNIEFPDSLPDGSQVKGNILGEMVRVKFTSANTDTPAVHHNGRVMPRWVLVGKELYDFEGKCVDPTGYIDIRNGHTAPGNNATYLRASFGAPVSYIIAHVLLFGARR